MGSHANAESPRQSEEFAAAMLALACLCWAAFFSLAKNWQEAADNCPGGSLIASLTLIGIRPLLALLVFAIIRPRLFIGPTRREWLVALFLGLLNFGGNVLQVWGLGSTTPARSGFFTSMASLWVPVIGLVFLRVTSPGATWFGLLLGIVGVGVLALNPSDGWKLNQGDVLTVLGSVNFAVFILFLGRLGRRVRSSQLTLGLIAGSGLPAIPLALGLSASGDGIDVLFAWLGDMLRNPRVVFDLLMLTLFSTVLATHLMGTYQPRVSASRAALIYLLEPVFAAVLSVLVGHDCISLRLLLGGMLILGGNALAELHVWWHSGRDSI